MAKICTDEDFTSDKLMSKECLFKENLFEIDSKFHFISFC